MEGIAIKKIIILVVITTVILLIGTFGIGNDVTLKFLNCESTYRQYQIKPFIQTSEDLSEDNARLQILKCLCSNKETNKDAIRQFNSINTYGINPEDNVDIDAVCKEDSSFGSSDMLRDPWSANCTAGTYAIFSEDSYSCEPLKPCTDDSECKYLEIDNLPPRSGECIDGQCKVFCGSGIIREC